MKPLNRDARTLVDSARMVEAPSEEYRERMRQRIAVSLGGAMVASAVAANSKAAVVQVGVAKATGAALWIKAGAIIVGIAILAAGGAALLWPDSAAQVVTPARKSMNAIHLSSTPKAPEPLPIPIASSPIAMTDPKPNIPVPAPLVRPRQTSALPARVRDKASTPAPAKSNTTALSQELMLLSRAQAALSSGEAARALALLDEHATTYPNGALHEERKAARVFALCALGRQEEARGEAQQFVSMAPRSPLAARVRGACSSGESSNSKLP